MSVMISMTIVGGPSIVGTSVKFETTIDDDEGDARDVGLAVYGAIRGIGIPRGLLSLAHAVAMLSDECSLDEADSDFVAAASGLIEFWEEHDKKLDDAMAAKGFKMPQH